MGTRPEEFFIAAVETCGLKSQALTSFAGFRKTWRAIFLLARCRWRSLDFLEKL